MNKRVDINNPYIHELPHEIVEYNCLNSLLWNLEEKEGWRTTRYTEKAESQMLRWIIKRLDYLLHVLRELYTNTKVICRENLYWVPFSNLIKFMKKINKLKSCCLQVTIMSEKYEPFSIESLRVCTTPGNSINY